MIRVPADAPTPAAALDMARPGDVVLLAEGTYPGGLVVSESHPGITIRGADRNRVVFDGRNEVGSAVIVRADGVTLENFTAHDFRADAVVWDSARGFTGRYLTVYRSGGYGIYAFDSTDGRLEHDLSSAAANAAFYIGECDPCRTLLTDLTATLSGLGYSGTNASGDLVVRDSRWIRNGTGILPNSFNEEAHPPQQRATFEGNTVVGSGTVPTPAADPLGGFIGLGIGLAGGQHDLVRDNRIVDSARYGIALFPTLQRATAPWRPLGNRITDNVVRGSGIADLALSAGSGPANCFAQNRAESSLPAGLNDEECDPARPGSARVARDLAVPAPAAYARSGPHPSYETMPAPGPQPNLPPRELASAPGSLPAAILVPLWLAPRRRRRRQKGTARDERAAPEPWGAPETTRSSVCAEGRLRRSAGGDRRPAAPPGGASRRR